MDRRLVAAGMLAVGLALGGCAAGAGAGRPDAQPTDPSPTGSAVVERFIVMLADAPVATYEGDADGHGRTAPEAGQAFDPNSPAALQRSAELIAQHEALAVRYGFTIATHYTHTLNGFAADLTEAQARELSKADGVTGVEADRVVPLDRSSPSVVDGS